MEESRLQTTDFDADHLTCRWRCLVLYNTDGRRIAVKVDGYSQNIITIKALSGSLYCVLT